MSINFGLYALTVIIPLAVGYTLKSIFSKRDARRRDAWKVPFLLMLILLLSPPLWTRFGPQTAWQEEAFIPTGSTIAMDGDVLVASGNPVMVYRHKETGWEKEAALMREGDDTRSFGGNVAIDHNTIFIRDHSEPRGGGVYGSIYASTYDGSQWSKPTRLPPLPSNDDVPGRLGSILSASGNILVNGTEDEVVYIYERASESEPWQFKTWLRQPDITGLSDRSRISGFGPAVTVDGDTLVVGGREYASGITVFVRDPKTGQWNFQASLDQDRSYSKPTGTGYGTGLGNAVALKGDVLVASATSLNEPDGMAFVYQRNPQSQTWRRVDTLKPIGGRPFWNYRRYYEYYGFGASIQYDGESIIIGTGNNRNPSRGRARGGAFVYAKNERTHRWYQQARLEKNGSPYARSFGTDVAISSNTLGVRGHLKTRESSGVYLFKRNL